MKKVLKLISVIAIMVTVLPFAKINTTTIEAKNSYSNYYSMKTSAYEVDVVNNNGGFDYKGSYNSFSEAKAAMNSLGNDAVVRHASSYSPTKIIAMVSGIAYSYPQRSGTSTLTITQYGTSSYYAKTTYISKHREVFYVSTDSYNGDGTGNVHINASGFDGVVNLKNIDLVPYKFIESNQAVYLGGNDATSENESPFSIKVQKSYYKVEKNGNYLELKFVAYTGWAVNGNAANTRFNTVIGPAASWMKEGDTYYSYNDYDFYTNKECTNKAGTYYNYYEFMPLRQKSNIPASAYNTFLSNSNYGSNSKLWNTGDAFVNAQNTYGINALMLFAQAVNESGWGKSYYAMNRNNLFGVAAYDDNPNNATYFSSVSEAINYQAGVLLRDYLDTDDYRFFGSHFGNKESGIAVKYASDPYYGLTLAALAYSFDKQYNGNNGNLTDYNAYQTGVINTYGVSIRNSINGSEMYSTEFGATYQRNYIVTMLEEKDGWYKVQSTNYISNGSKQTTKGQGYINYDWNASVGWVEKNYVSIIGGVATNTTIDTTTAETIGTAKVNVSNLRVRTGPGLSYGDIGYCTDGGTYTIYNTASADGYTWYQFDNNKWFADNGSWITYTANKTADTTTPEIEVPEVTPSNDSLAQVEQINSPSEDTSLLSTITDISFDEETHVTTIRGLAFYQGVDANDGSVTHNLIVSDPDTKKSYVFPCTTSTSNSINYNDGHTYSAIGFNVAIDLDMFTSGNYNLGIQVINGSKNGYHSFFMSNSKNNHEYINDGTLVRLMADPIANYRLSISVEKQGVDLSTVNKPTKKTSKFGTLDSISLANGHMTFSAYSAIYLTNFTTETNPTYEILLEDESGNVTTHQTQLSSNQMDISSFMYGDYKYTNCCFDVDADLTNLSAGTYRVYVHVKNDSYNDIFEMYNLQSAKTISESTNGRTYTLTKSNVRSRYILTIE